jgi:hypothetical protein
MVRDAGFCGARTCVPEGLDCSKDTYAAGITMHLSNGSPRYVVKTCLDFHLGIRSMLDWETRAKALFDRALDKGVVFHIWGHSWEVDMEGGWGKLERVLAHISRRQGVVYVSNSEAWSGQEEGR